jgi:hypothetical protein
MLHTDNCFGRQSTAHGGLQQPDELKGCCPTRIVQAFACQEARLHQCLLLWQRFQIISTQAPVPLIPCISDGFLDITGLLGVHNFLCDFESRRWHPDIFHHSARPHQPGHSWNWQGLAAMSACQIQISNISCPLLYMPVNDELVRLLCCSCRGIFFSHLSHGTRESEIMTCKVKARSNPPQTKLTKTSQRDSNQVLLFDFVGFLWGGGFCQRDLCLESFVSIGSIV